MSTVVRRFLVHFTGPEVPQALEKIGILDYEKTTSKLGVMRDITHTSLHSSPSVMRDVKTWS